MHKSRRFPRFRSFRFGFLTLLAFFFVTNLTDVTSTRAFAPTVEARAVAAAEDFIPADIPTSGDHALDLIIYRAASCQGVDPRLIHAVVWQESRYKPSALSHKGAQGLMQLMSATAKRFDCADTSDAEANIEAGTKYLRWLLERFDGDVTLALAGYNAGEGSVDKYDGVPPYGETQNYVRVITERYGKTHHPLFTPEEARLAFNLAP